jgi:hypothetical protein
MAKNEKSLSVNTSVLNDHISTTRSSDLMFFGMNAFGINYGWVVLNFHNFPGWFVNNV